MATTIDLSKLPAPAVVETLEGAMLSLRQRGQPIDISPARMAS